MQYESIWSEAQRHRGCLSHLATTTGRRRDVRSEGDPFEIGNPFIEDEAKLLHSKSWRLLKDKTQVATLAENPFIRNRATHVLEVAGIGVILAQMLGLNADLARAIALCHDIGHVPLGHQGEAFMAEAMRKPFCHEVMGVVVLQKIERKGRGLNNTFEMLEGGMCHSGSRAHESMTPEAWVIRYGDKFAYIFADYNDIVYRMQFPIPTEIHQIVASFGRNQRERVTTAMSALIVESAECEKVSFEHSVYAKRFSRLRELMYGVYPQVTEQNPRRILEPILEFLTRMKLGDPFLLLALMTDRDVMYLESLRMPNAAHLQHTAIGETIHHLTQIGPVDLCDPDLSW